MNRIKIVVTAILMFGITAPALLAGGTLAGKKKDKNLLSRVEQRGMHAMDQAESASQQAYQLEETHTLKNTEYKAPAPKVQKTEETEAASKVVTGTKAIRLTRQERKDAKRRLKDNKKEIRSKIKAEKEKRNSNPGSSGSDMLLYVILAILLPPLAVGLFEGGLTTNFWVDLILTLLFFVPGLIYALVVILK